ncbi:hypothetical protein TNCV_4602491 [Trichonephila clavipes]|nr:hypothetical protein TNCV_4602491 [Trichonephila clavipes]
MSPIEHVSDLVGWRVAREPHPAASKDKLLLRIQAIWNSIRYADIQILFDLATSYSSTYCSVLTHFQLKRQLFQESMENEGPIRWLGNVESDLKIIGINRWRAIAPVRARWRRVCEAALA